MMFWHLSCTYALVIASVAVSSIIESRCVLTVTTSYGSPIWIPYSPGRSSKPDIDDIIGHSGDSNSGPSHNTFAEQTESSSRVSPSVHLWQPGAHVDPATHSSWSESASITRSRERWTGSHTHTAGVEVDRFSTQSSEWNLWGTSTASRTSVPTSTSGFPSSNPITTKSASPTSTTKKLSSLSTSRFDTSSKTSIDDKTTTPSTSTLRNTSATTGTGLADSSTHTETMTETITSSLSGSTGTTTTVKSSTSNDATSTIMATTSITMSTLSASTSTSTSTSISSTSTSTTSTSIKTTTESITGQTTTSSTATSATSILPGPCATLTGSKYRLQSTSNGKYATLQTLNSPSYYEIEFGGSLEEAAVFQFRSDCTFETGDSVYRLMGYPNQNARVIFAPDSQGGSFEVLKCSFDNTDSLACVVGNQNKWQLDEYGYLHIGETVIWESILVKPALWTPPSTTTATTTTETKATAATTTSTSAATTRAAPCAALTGKEYNILATGTNDDTIDGTWAKYVKNDGESGYQIKFGANRINAQAFSFRADCTFGTANPSLQWVAENHLVYAYAAAQTANNILKNALVCAKSGGDELTCYVEGDTISGGRQSLLQVFASNAALIIEDAPSSLAYRVSLYLVDVDEEFK